MTATLCIPRPPVHGMDSKVVYRFPLRWTDQHPASHYGAGVLLTEIGDSFDGFMFRYLRDTVGARIVTDDTSGVSRALGVRAAEHGIYFI